MLRIGFNEISKLIHMGNPRKFCGYIDTKIFVKINKLKSITNDIISIAN